MVRKAGFTILETIVAVSMASVMLLATTLLLFNSTTTWRKVVGEQDASGQLLKAEAWMRRDLNSAAFQALDVGDSLSSLTGKDGDAVWFLSAIDPATGEFVRNPDGTPHWQTNILYYLVVPTGDNPTGFSGGGIQDNGYEVSHPGKVLVRKVIDDVAAPATETLLSDVSSYLEAPDGGSFSGPASDSASIAARNLLSLRVDTNPDLEAVNILIQAAKIEEQQLRFALGSRSLLTPEFLLERRFDMYPDNLYLPPSP